MWNFVYTYLSLIQSGFMKLGILPITDFYCNPWALFICSWEQQRGNLTMVIVDARKDQRLEITFSQSIILSGVNSSCSGKIHFRSNLLYIIYI